MSDFEVVPVGACTSAVAERDAIVGYLHDQAASIRRMAGRRVSTNHVLGEDEADQLARRIDALAAGIRSRLHLSDGSA